MFFLKILLSIINDALSFGENLKEHRKHCAFTVKDKGPRKNKRCAFPFRFEGKLYKGVCTNEKVTSYFNTVFRFLKCVSRLFQVYDSQVLHSLEIQGKDCVGARTQPGKTQPGNPQPGRTQPGKTQLGSPITRKRLNPEGRNPERI